MTRGQLVYRGCAQMAAWAMTAMMWVAPGAYAMNQWFDKQWIEGVYAGIGCFVVFRLLRELAQGEADGNQGATAERAVTPSASEAP